MDGMEIDARIDSSKRVKRSSPDDTNSAKPIWQHKPSSITVNSLEKRYSVTQKNLRNQNGKNGVIVSPNVGNSFSFQPCDVRIKGKELESKRNDRENSLVLEASTSNRLMVRKHDDITNRSIKDKEVSSHVGVRLKSQINGHDKALSKTSYIDSFAGNTGWAEAISRKNEEKSASQDPSGGVSTLEVKSTHVLHSESHHAIKKKGKLIFGDDMQYSEPTSQYIRASLFGKEVATIAEEQESSFKFGQNLDQQKCHDFKLNMQNQSLHEFQSFYNENFCSSNFTEQRHETDVENLSYKNPLTTIHNYRSSSLYKNPLTTIRDAQAFPDSVVNERNYSWKKHVKGKEKSKSSLPNFRKTSGPNLNQQSHPPSSESSDFEADKRNKNRCHGTTSMEIDNIYPEITNCTLRGQQIGVFDSCARASQIESDEKFARELQQQFYHETTRFIDMEKKDETIAWSLQQDEDVDVALVFEGLSKTRYSSGTCLNDDSQPSALFESYSASAGLTPFRNFEYVERCPQMALLDEIRNNFNNEVVTETRLDLLEAMEDVLENSDIFEADDYTYNYSFNDTDHEMQLELDERSHRRARSSEINNLPVSFVQQNSNNSNNEACTVCLEIPSMGEKLRHLPCMHKFHKLCIDTWLKRKPSCPVCKSKIA